MKKKFKTIAIFSSIGVLYFFIGFKPMMRQINNANNDYKQSMDSLEIDKNYWDSVKISNPDKFSAHIDSMASNSDISNTSSTGTHYVKGYTRKDGTVVSGHFRK